MAILSDNQIRKKLKGGEIIIDPFFEPFLGPNLYYCHLGDTLLKVKRQPEGFVCDPLVHKSSDLYEEIKIAHEYILQPNEFVLATVFEFLGTDGKHVIRLLNSSSFARVGISQAALGMINAGCGIKQPVRLTLELINNFPYPVKLKPTKITLDGKVGFGTEVLKIVVEEMKDKPSIIYDDWKHGVYSGDKKAVGPKMAGRFTDQKLALPKISRYFKKA